MHSVGIICEYNPYHMGHAHHLAAARQDTGAPIVVAVMSEHITQRGELAIADGYVRAEAAVRTGADIVLGLPFPYSGAPAEFFALAGVRILNAVGVDALHFGSECGDINALTTTADRTAASTFIDNLKEYQAAHPTQGVLPCREAVYQEMYGATLPGGSNDLLALAYLTALQQANSTMRPFTTRRIGQEYNDTAAPVVASVYPSASALRALWQAHGLDTLRPHLPAPVYDTLTRAAAQGLAPLRMDALDAAVIAHYRTASPVSMGQFAEMSGGVAERLCHAAQSATTVSDLLLKAATRRYTDGRLRRALLYGLCDVPAEQLSTPPAYVRLLGAGERGTHLLKEWRKTAPLPLVTKPADIPNTPAARRQRAIEERLEALLTLAYPIPREKGFLAKARPYIEQDRD